MSLEKYNEWEFTVSDEWGELDDVQISELPMDELIDLIKQSLLEGGFYDK
jgi:hypothetical protein